MDRILVVAMLDSVHTLRWMDSALKFTPHKYLLSPSGPHRRLHPGLIELEENYPSRLQIVGKTMLHGLFSYALDIYLFTGMRTRKLVAQIEEFRPSVLHAMELQHAGYLCLEAINKNRRQINGMAFAVSNWGSDIYWFGRFKQHRQKIIQVLSEATHYTAECRRDIRLARKLGFNGVEVDPFPNSANFKESLKVRNRLLTNPRRKVLVKGYHGWAGRSRVALAALCRIRHEIRDFEIVFYSASLITRLRCKFAGAFWGLRISAYPKHAFSSEEMQELFLSSMIFIGISRTDGLSTSALEAMAFGAIPVQSKTSCIAEILPEGGGILVQSNRVETVSKSISEGLRIAKYGQSSRSNNYETVMKIAGNEVIGSKIAHLYRVCTSGDSLTN